MTAAFAKIIKPETHFINQKRQAFFEERVAARYRKGKASYIASYFELDGVIDPADSRAWIIKGLNGASHNIP